MKLIDTQRFRVRPGQKVDLRKVPTRFDGGLEKEAAHGEFHRLTTDLRKSQDLMYAQGAHALLVVFQAMDACGKDSTIKNVFQPIDPAGVHVVSFKSPTKDELSRDFLWRVHEHAPPKGYVAVFNRSHYEDVLIARVKNLVPEARWKKRYDHINDFEKMLVDEGTTVVKIFLHASKAYQKERLQRRLDRPDKHWKFNPEDLSERLHWDDYMRAYEAALSRCSPDHAPWYIVPAETRWYRDLVVASVLKEAFDGMKMKLPRPSFDPKTIVIPD